MFAVFPHYMGIALNAALPTIQSISSTIMYAVQLDTLLYVGNTAVIRSVAFAAIFLIIMLITVVKKKSNAAILKNAVTQSLPVVERKVKVKEHVATKRQWLVAMVSVGHHVLRSLMLFPVMK